MLPENVTYENHRGAYVVWDGDESTAEDLKDQYPGEDVLLYDKTSGSYTPYYATVVTRAPRMKNGRLYETIREEQE